MRKGLAVFLLSACALAAAEKKIIFPAGAKVVGPYSPGIVVGDLLYVSGQGAKGPDGTFPTSVADQVKQCLDNVKLIVEAAGLTMDHLVYAQIYNPNPQAWDEIDRAWAAYFPKNGPARAVLGVEKLPDNTPVEINAVAVLNLADKKVVANGAAVMSRDRIFVSGVFGETPEIAIERLGEALRGAGADYRHLVFVNPYMLSSVGYEQMNSAYAKRFEFGNTPARATIYAAHLPGKATIEFTGVAVRDLSKRRAVRPKNMPPSPTASPCVFAGDTMYCSAKSAFIPGPVSGTYASTVEEQVRMSIRNLLDGLEEGDLKLEDVVATNVYLDDIADFPKMNRVYAQYFKGTPPTRTTVQQIPAVPERKANDRDIWPSLEQISLIAVK